jgi:hypothetical protein
VGEVAFARNQEWLECRLGALPGGAAYISSNEASQQSVRDCAVV